MTKQVEELKSYFEMEIQIKNKVRHLTSLSRLSDKQGSQFLAEAMGMSLMNVDQINLLYRATEHGFNAADFHDRCINKGPTLTLIKNDQNLIFGGFTMAAWDTSTAYKMDSEAFVFSLSKKRKYPIKANLIGNAIYNNPNHGPTFGNGHDIYICNQSNTVNSSYSNPAALSFAYSVPAQLDMSGTYNFKTLEIEVFQVVFK